VLFRDGVPVATSVGGEVELRIAADPGATRTIERALRQGPGGSAFSHSAATLPA
jgi:hypothetical protein